MENRIDARKKDFKKAFHDPVRRRETAQVQIRKNIRETHLAKRRLDASTASFGPGSATTGGVGGEPVVNIEDLRMLVELLQSNDLDQNFTAVQSIRKMLSVENSPPIQTVVNLGVVPRLVKLLTLDHRPDIQFEVAWALTNIASGTHDQTRAVLQAGAVPFFVRLLSSPEATVRDQSVWALGNIAGDSAEFRDQVLQAGALEPLLNELRAADQSNVAVGSIQHAAWTLSNFCRGKPAPRFESVAASLPVLRLLLRSNDLEILSDSCWAVSYISDATDEADSCINAIIDNGLCRHLVDLLGHSNPNVQTPALRAVGNIVAGDDRQTQTVIGHQGLPRLKALLSSKKTPIVKEACWTISNITAGTCDQIEEVIANGIIPELVQLLNSCGDVSVKREAAWAISNAVSGGNARQIAALVEAQCLKPLVELLDVTEHRIVKVALEAIKNILEVGKKRKEKEDLVENPYVNALDEAGGFPKLEKLQLINKADISGLVRRIMEDYLDVEAEPEEEPFAASSAFGGMS